MDPIRIVSLSVAGTVIALAYFIVKLLSSGEDQKLLARRLKQRREARIGERIGERLDDSYGPAPDDASGANSSGTGGRPTKRRRSRIGLALQRLGLAAAQPF